MLKNYWVVALRTLIRNKVYSLVNILGLTFGICTCLVIYLITSHEFSFDNFHPDHDRIFCVDATMHGGHLNCIPGPMPADMRREMTGLQTVTAFQTYAASVTIPAGQGQKPNSFDDDGTLAIAEPQYFDIFRHQWLSGNPATSLTMPNSVVLTGEKARKYFGDHIHRSRRRGFRYSPAYRRLPGRKSSNGQSREIIAHGMIALSSDNRFQ